MESLLPMYQSARPSHRLALHVCASSKKVAFKTLIANDIKVPAAPWPQSPVSTKTREFDVEHIQALHGCSRRQPCGLDNNPVRNSLSGAFPFTQCLGRCSWCSRLLSAQYSPPEPVSCETCSLSLRYQSAKPAGVGAFGWQST